MATSQADFSAFLASGQYSDLQLKCLDEVFNVHKIIVCAQSTVIHAAVNGEFRVRANTIRAAYHSAVH
jgi:hypothetical protein